MKKYDINLTEQGELIFTTDCEYVTAKTPAEALIQCARNVLITTVAMCEDDRCDRTEIADGPYIAGLLLDCALGKHGYSSYEDCGCADGFTYNTITIEY